MKLFTAQQMRQADKAAAASDLATQLLMETAGQKVTEAVLRSWPDAKTFLVLCGKGNNGGDGYVAARHLNLGAKRVCVLELASTQDALSTDDSRAARLAWLAQDVLTQTLTVATLQRGLKNADVVVDALFGSGLSRALEGELAELVNILNNAGLPILSVDVPSGLSADEPAPTGPHIQASRTLQLAGPKLSSVLAPAKDAYGLWEVAPIGIPEKILDAQSSLHFLRDDNVKAWLPQRGSDAHKYTAGTVLVIAGSSRYLGAAELASRAAYRAGAGLVTLAAQERLPDSWPEIIFEGLEWENQPLERLEGLSPKRAQARVIGPGLDESAQPYLPELILQSRVPTVLDAGALTGDAAWQEAIKRHGRCILTPHVGEAASLLEERSEGIERNPVAAAGRLAERFAAITVLKGAATLIASPNGRITLSSRGHPGMATGGAGDVLAGLLGAWLANVEEDGTLFERTAAAVFLHGAAGERAAERYGYGLVATDILKAFPECWLELSQNRDQGSGAGVR